jgi:hypothetical protein
MFVPRLAATHRSRNEARSSSSTVPAAERVIEAACPRHGVCDMSRRSHFDPSRLPRDPHWALAPASMAWEGRTLGEICTQFEGPAAQWRPRRCRYHKACNQR